MADPRCRETTTADRGPLLFNLVLGCDPELTVQAVSGEFE
jgi:hypothetical protein